jgi:hypothetical protein
LSTTAFEPCAYQVGDVNSSDDAAVAALYHRIKKVSIPKPLIVLPKDLWDIFLVVI